MVQLLTLYSGDMNRLIKHSKEGLGLLSLSTAVSPKWTKFDMQIGNARTLDHILHVLLLCIANPC